MHKRKFSFNDINESLNRVSFKCIKQENLNSGKKIYKKNHKLRKNKIM